MKDRRYYNQLDKKIAKRGGYEVNDIHRGPEDEGKQANFERRMKRIGKGDKIKSGAQKKRIKAYMGESIYSRVYDILEGSRGIQRLTRVQNGYSKKANKAIKPWNRNEFNKAADKETGAARRTFRKQQQRRSRILQNMDKKG